MQMRMSLCHFIVNPFLPALNAKMAHAGNNNLCCKHQIQNTSHRAGSPTRSSLCISFWLNPSSGNMTQSWQEQRPLHTTVLLNVGLL